MPLRCVFPWLLTQYRREYHIGETYYVVAHPKSARAQIELSSFVQAVAHKNVLVLCRFVPRAHAEPRLCMLAPLIEEALDAFYMVRVPFCDDVHRFAFPPLDRLPVKGGGFITKHATIPDSAQQASMDAFVDAMDLMDMDEDGDAEGWYAPTLSLNPAIHGIRHALKWRFLRPDAPLPPRPAALERFLTTPTATEQRARAPRDAAAAAFAVHLPAPSRAPTRAPAAPPSKPPPDDSDETPDEDAFVDVEEAPSHVAVGPHRIRLGSAAADFAELIRTSDAISEACVAMQTVLFRLLEEDTSPDASRITSALHAFRSCAAEYDEALLFNEFVARHDGLTQLPAQVSAARRVRAPRVVAARNGSPSRSRAHNARRRRRPPLAGRRRAGHSVLVARL